MVLRMLTFPRRIASLEIGSHGHARRRRRDKNMNGSAYQSVAIVDLCVQARTELIYLVK